MDAENKIDYIEIPARDLGKARQFFEGLFEWPFEDYGPEYCAFNDGRTAGGFYRAETSISAKTSALVVFYRADLHAAKAKIRELGGTITKDIFSFPGGKRFHFADPNGNEYAIWSDSDDKAKN